MTYQTKCNGTCSERIDQQADTIKTKDKHMRMQSQALKDASEWIVKLQDEKAELTALVNKLSERNKFLEGEYKYYRGREKAEEWF